MGILSIFLGPDLAAYRKSSTLYGRQDNTRLLLGNDYLLSATTFYSQLVYHCLPKFALHCNTGKSYRTLASAF
jgi:hypothetical protein